MVANQELKTLNNTILTSNKIFFEIEIPATKTDDYFRDQDCLCFQSRPCLNSSIRSGKFNRLE